MMFFCKKCDNTVEVVTLTITIKDDKIFYPEALCNCGSMMEDVTEPGGLGTALQGLGGKVRGKF